MKKATVQVSFDADKLKATRLYMQKKDAEMQPELEDALQKLYEKYVPQPVREYIECGTANSSDKPPRPPRTNRKTTESTNVQA